MKQSKMRFLYLVHCLVLVWQWNVTVMAAPEPPSQVRWDLYHKSDAILDFFKKTALKLPTRVRCELLVSALPQCKHL